MEWLPMLANQMELMMKCISLLADSKGPQIKILDMKSTIDMLLAFGTELVLDIHLNFLGFW